MDAGLTVYNDNDSVQIDSNFKNLAIKKRTQLYSFTEEPYVRSVFRIQFSSEFPFLAVACAYSVGLAATARVGTNLWSFDFVVDAAAGTPATFYIFAPGGEQGDLGLQVFDASGPPGVPGAMVFNSNEVYADIIDVAAAGNYTDLVGVRTYPQKTSLAVAFGGLAGYWLVGKSGAPGADFGLYREERGMLAASINGESITLAQQPYWNFLEEQGGPPFPTSTWWQRKAQVIVVDVERANRKIPLT